MFCKVCYDAMKPGYETHNVKDYASNVICPLLLNTKCNKCGFFGHTVKYCKINIIKKVVKVEFSADVNMTYSNGGIKNLFELLDNTFDNTCMESSNNNIIDDDIIIDDIIWGVGLKSMIGKRWADVC